MGNLVLLLISIGRKLNEFLLFDILKKLDFIYSFSYQLSYQGSINHDGGWGCSVIS